MSATTQPPFGTAAGAVLGISAPPMPASAGSALPPLIEGACKAVWRGRGRYERGDRRDRSLVHWSYGQRVDAARIRRVLAMLDDSWNRGDPAGRRGKAYATAAGILTEIARCWDSTARISRICKSSIALRLGLHRNTVYRYCRLMEKAGILIQGLYDAPKDNRYKSYAVWAIAGMTGRLPLFLSFRRRYARHARLAEIRWPMNALAAWGRRAASALVPDTPRTSPETDPEGGGETPDILSKNPKIVHNTCNPDSYPSRTVRAAPNRRSAASAPDARGRYGPAPPSGTRQRSSAAAPKGVGGPALRRLGSVLATEPSGGEGTGLEGKASRHSTSGHDRHLSAIERVRARLAAYERDLGHLPSWRPPAGFPRGWMRRRMAGMDDGEWDRLIQLALRLPMVNGAAPMRDGRMFKLTIWWLIRHAPRLLALTAPETPEPEAARPRPACPEPVHGERSQHRPLTEGERERMMAQLRTRSPELAAALERLGRSIRDEEE